MGFGFGVNRGLTWVSDFDSEFGYWPSAFAQQLGDPCIPAAIHLQPTHFQTTGLQTTG